MIDENVLAMAFLLSVANKALIDYIAEPVRKRFPEVDLWWLPYVALVSGGVIGYLANINLFIPAQLVGLAGRLLTAAVIGGGSSLLHNITDHADVRRE